ncbi:MAG: MarR family winged helix-turn-helix transcriptional regulator [Lachnospiraceae bacterium]|nr:MarR family winged helix-turn-helix transcriptional regulator [Lachnospiraceae bacterium]MDY5498291.1 MarR family winged helix-turn-helix transcriptional regulator [Anaerobutyricum sp.]
MEDRFMNVFGKKIKKLLEKKAEPLSRKYGIRNIELEILLFLYHSPCGNTAKDIVMERHISKAHISKSVDNLRTKGFVLLTEDLDDHRKKHIVLTGKGEMAAEELLKVHEECRRIITASVTEEEKEVLKSVMEKIFCNLDEELKKY